MSVASAPPQAPSDNNAVGRATLYCLIAYITAYCLESPLRYMLYLVHASSLVLLRDLLIDIPLVCVFVAQLMRQKLHGAFVAFIIVAAIQVPIFWLNFGVSNIFASIFGLKLIVNTLLGILACQALMVPNRRTYRLFAALLIISIIALVAEKLGAHFPWVGLHDYVGGADVELARDWQIDDPILRRVGGFFRDSIGAAEGIATLCIVVACQTRGWIARTSLLLFSFGALILTTQKGAIVAFALVLLALLFPIGLRLISLRILVVSGAFLNAALPFFTNGIDMVVSRGGVASSMSFGMRVKMTWPNSWAWVASHSVFPFGVGIGGMGVPLKKIAPTAWMFPDNMFIFTYAYFGVFAVIFYLLFAYGAWRSLRMSSRDSEVGLATLAFFMFYGIVVSTIEDQLAALYLGAATGLLLTGATLELTPRRAAAARPGESMAIV